MKFTNIQTSDGQRLAVIVDSDTQRYWPLADSGFAGSITDLIGQWAVVEPLIITQGEGSALDSVTLKAPIRADRNVFCVGKNYLEHAVEFSKSGFDHSAKEGEVAPEFPVVFTKTPDSVIGHLQDIPAHPRVTQQLDYEAELAVIIGKGGRGISREAAYEHVWGYTIVNDMTARDLQKNHRQWFLGKSLDGFCPMGPWIVTADEFNPHDATLQCWVNGELRQSANVNQLIFDIPALIECISAGIALKPGDVISTGTPLGVGIGFTPPRFLQPGDSVRIEIAGIGVLENRISLSD